MIIKNVNPTKLFAEFSDAKLDITFNKLFLKYVNGVATSDLGDLEVVFSANTDMDLVQQIIDAHDPTPIPPAPTQDDFFIDLELRMTMLELGLTL